MSRGCVSGDSWVSLCAFGALSDYSWGWVYTLPPPPAHFLFSCNPGCRMGNGCFLHLAKALSSPLTPYPVRSNYPCLGVPYLHGPRWSQPEVRARGGAGTRSLGAYVSRQGLRVRVAQRGAGRRGVPPPPQRRSRGMDGYRSAWVKSGPGGWPRRPPRPDGQGDAPPGLPPSACPGPGQTPGGHTALFSPLQGNPRRAPIPTPGRFI